MVMVCNALRRLASSSSRWSAVRVVVPPVLAREFSSSSSSSSSSGMARGRGDSRHLERINEVNPDEVQDNIIFDGEKYTPGKSQGSFPTTVFVYPTCPHCNKVLAFLDILGHEHTIINVNPITKYEIKWSESYKKVPIACVGSETLHGSDNIILNIYDKWAPHTNKIAKGVTREDYDMWNKRVDEEVARPLFRATSSTWSDALNYTAYVRKMSAYPGYIRFLHHMVGTFFTMVGSRKVAKRYGIVDPASELLLAVKSYLDHFGVKPQQQQQQVFCGGSTPSFADVLLYGTIRSVQDFKAVDQLLDADDERIKSWYSAMQAAAGHE
mmetsp:Transcript_11124/g.21322  ORF Transcript_11124/g.21322 Transcript_11124/m.21322 type:complete len:325 (-) Transcript_11124:296-1270(-)|eukprot:CAMPEP_0170177106 /NCGR_PEP_ID=MMETSP0040_2-20121228/9829_1 /TAXON_ID=641309 /ORGANISM="Lotharella oceanica, Strain CCMP622" /LENGTH=324 /DNA_ID=CAMNT_0010419637 /DNA_START=1 /DNA_END=975 /DNA_ORIENTATION=+